MTFTEREPRDWSGAVAVLRSIDASRNIPMLAALAALLYAVGFVVVTAYLASYGVREIEPIRPRYVAAAIPFLSIVVGTWAAMDGTRHAITSGAPIGRRRGAFYFVLWLIVSGLVALGSTALVWSLLFYLESYTVADFQTGLDQFGSVFRFVTLVVLGYWFMRRAGMHRRLSRHSLNDAVTGGLLVVLLGLPLTYVSIYRLTPTWLGGGRPETVELTLRTPISGCRCDLTEVQLLDEDAQRVLILASSAGPDQHAIEIAARNVLAIRHVAAAPRP